MARGSLRGGLVRSAVALTAAWLWCGGAAQAQFFPFFGQPQPQRSPQAEPQALSYGQIRAVLAREGARLVGKPRLRGDSIIAIGRDEAGDRKRFTLDALSGEILDVTVLARHEDRPPASDLAPPGAALPPPSHGPQGGDAPRDVAAPAQDRAVPVLPSATRADPADKALSPIRPLRAPGAPKVEPLPN
jgi:hypothetical protein